MSDRAPAAIQPGSSAYRAPGVALWRAVFRPLRPDLESVGRYAAILAGALAGGLLFRWHTPVGYVVLLLALALAVLPPLLGRGLWGWQAVLISSGLRSRTQIKAIVGEVNDKAAAEWLAASSGASASDRYHVLAFLGRDEEAERLIPELPTSTPDERFDRVWNEVGRDWRTTSALDVKPMTEMLPELVAQARVRAEIDIAFMQALDAAGAGRSLATLPPPPRVELSMAGRLLAWWHRYWLVWRTLLVFAVTAIISVLVVR